MFAGEAGDWLAAHWLRRRCGLFTAPGPEGESEMVRLAAKLLCGNTFSEAKRPKGLAGAGLGRYPSRFLAQV